MITAKEAREKSENSISDKTKEQLLAAEQCIETAVKNGETKVWCGKYFGAQAIKKLKELGYTIEDRSNQRDGTTFLISW